VPFDNIISRADADALIPVPVANEIIGHIADASAAMSLFRRVPMSAKQRRIPVVSALPLAYFVNGDTGLKQTSEVNWENKFLDAEEIASIIPIPEAVLDDSQFPIWASVQPMVAEAVGRALDGAIYFGDQKPASWPGAIVPTAIARGKVVARGSNTADTGGLAGDFSDLFARVENDGFDVSGLVLSRAYKGRLRQVRSSIGVQLSEVSVSDVYGIDPRYTLRGMWPTGVNAAEGIAGDYQYGLLGVRQDMTYKILDQAVISDAAGKVIYNLPQQDMLALRVVARFAFQVGDPITHEAPNAATRYPFAVLRSPASAELGADVEPEADPEAEEAEAEPESRSTKSRR
jgi:HK97 family phage major capsid protein